MTKTAQEKTARLAEFMGYVRGEIYLDHADGDIAKYRENPDSLSWLDISPDGGCREFGEDLFRPYTSHADLALVLRELSEEQVFELSLIIFGWGNLGDRSVGILSPHDGIKTTLLLFATEPGTICDLILESIGDAR